MTVGATTAPASRSEKWLLPFASQLTALDGSPDAPNLLIVSSACHGVDLAGTPFGPSLRAVYGRRLASLEDFARNTDPLVRDLRETESRRATVRDTPIITGIHRPVGEILAMLDGGRR